MTEDRVAFELACFREFDDKDKVCCAVFAEGTGDVPTFPKRAFSFDGAGFDRICDWLTDIDVDSHLAQLNTFFEAALAGDMADFVLPSSSELDDKDIVGCAVVANRVAFALPNTKKFDVQDKVGCAVVDDWVAFVLPSAKKVTTMELDDKVEVCCAVVADMASETATTKDDKMSLDQEKHISSKHTSRSKTQSAVDLKHIND